MESQHVDDVELVESDSDDSEVSDDSSTNNYDSTSSATVTSVLKRLKSPTPSNLTRKRKIRKNPPVGKKKSRGIKGANDPKSISPSERIRQFPDEYFKVSNKKLFCTACREELSLRKNILTNHVRSSKHKEGKKRLFTKSTKESDIAEALVMNDKECHPVGETLPISTRVYRVKVVTAFLKAGIALNKLDVLSEIFEENAYVRSHPLCTELRSKSNKGRNC